ncbi:hypothetical protein ACFE04_005987 [Oxalis oulophora]
MEDHQSQDHLNSPNHKTTSHEPVRSRWTPKPEQILILESIFNSGMVNPPKDETVRIRKLLEKFGAVGDANVFYWFQNRRSRSRRRQRQMQASLAQQQASGSGSGAIHFESNTNNNISTSCALSFSPNSSAGAQSFANTSPSYFVPPSSTILGGVDSLFHNLSPSQMVGFQDIEHSSSVTSVLCPSETSTLQFQSGFITVFINGVPTEVPRGTLDMKAMFGDQDVILVHSSGVPVPINEFGFLMHSLQHGESYFLRCDLLTLSPKP